MSRYDNLVHARDATIRLLLGMVALLALLLLVALVGWSRAPDHIRLHYPPDLGKGAVQTIGDIPKASLYTFAYYVFQQLNRWPVDGKADYHDQLHRLRAYFTPACFEERLQDLASREREIAGRVRSVWEIPGRGFENGRVQVVAANQWLVGLDLHVQETYRGERVKDRLIHYPLRVVAYDVDPQSNPWGLALDCLADVPRVIEVRDTAQEGAT
jgi:integrating conjugative element protein (TIGR03746 family)